jgi:hypothetical protein
MTRGTKRWLWGLGTALILLGAAGPSNAPAGAAELYAPETLDRYFQLEWSRAGKNVNGYVYNTGNRRAAHMILLVEGLDGADRRRLSGVGPVLRLGRRPSGSPQGLVGR